MKALTYPSSSFAPRPSEVRTANRAVSWSVGVHVAAVLAVFLLPRSWFARKPQAPVMTISLGGTPGPKSTGTTSMGGRTVEQVAPPPKRPEPVRPTPEVKPAPMPVKSPPRAAVERPAQKTPKPPPLPAVRPPIMGPRMASGSTAVDTGARGQGAGLTFGGGGLGGETDDKDFCCPDYLVQVMAAVDSVWHKDQLEHGATTLRFTVQRNGAIRDVTVFQSSGVGILDRASKDALSEARLPPLPPAYTPPTLAIRLTFPYGPQ
jgi:TonB family protein